jgi:hypothetical protein
MYIINMLHPDIEPQKVNKTILQYLEKEISDGKTPKEYINKECLLLGGILQKSSVCYTKNKPSLKLLYSNVIQLYKNNQDLTQIHFITVRPSPEYIYSLQKFIPSYDVQYQRYLRLFCSKTNITLLACSIETGTDKNSILHYHLIIKCLPKKLKKYLTFLKDNSTYLHKIYNYQKAVKVSETIAYNVVIGYLYFHGLKYSLLNDTIQIKQKKDHYKQLLQVPVDVLSLATLANGLASSFRLELS